MPTPSPTRTQAEEAARSLLTNLRDWIVGLLPDDEETFQRCLAGLMHPDVRIVMPSGAELGYDDWTGAVRGAHGSNPEYAFHLTDFRVAFAGSGCILLTFHEWQENAVTGPRPLNGRVTTVLFTGDEAGLRMRHVQQTWLPPEAVKEHLDHGAR